MISHVNMQKAMRTKALTLSVATTGAVSITATTTGYTRASGSFLTDGFAVGMELVGVGFSESENNDAKTITKVAASVLTAPGCAVEGAGSRTLTVGMPQDRLWENLPLEPTRGRPYVEEQYLPGPTSQATLGPLADLEVLPQYVLNIYAVSDVGLTGAAAYADALITLFAPRTEVALANGDILRVRGDVGPFRGQLVQSAPGWAVVPVTVPFRLRTANTI